MDILTGYLVIGTLLAISYIVTSGWSDMNLFFPISTVLFWPLYAVVGFITYARKG